MRGFGRPRWCALLLPGRWSGHRRYRPDPVGGVLQIFPRRIYRRATSSERGARLLHQPLFVGPAAGRRGQEPRPQGMLFAALRQASSAATGAGIAGQPRDADGAFLPLLVGFRAPQPQHDPLRFVGLQVRGCKP